MIVAILILTVIGYPPSSDAVVDLCGQAVLEMGFRRDPVITELIDFSNNEVRLKSAVAGQFIIHRIVDPNVTLKILIALARAADKAAHASSYYYSILKALMRHGNLQALLPEKDRQRPILTYYESIKGLSQAKTQPLFWLQYAIACLFLEKYERAEKYFKTAYSFAEAREYWDSFQIDNHYARFVLVRAISLGDASTCMTAFRNARKLIHNQIERERLHYPYRVASLYADFYDKFAPELKAQNKEEVKRAAKHICERIAKLPLDRQQQRYVHECWENLQRVVESTI